MSRVLTYLGGPRDGEAAHDTGHWHRVPILRPISPAAFDATRLPEPCERREVMEFRAVQDIDGRWWYVPVGAPWGQAR